MRRSTTVLLACIVVVAVTATVSAQGIDRARMHGILDSLSQILVLGHSPGGFADEKHAETIEDSLDHLVANARQLANHGDSPSRGFSLIAGSLAADANAALRRYRSGDINGSRRLVQRLGDACFACHSRIPAADGPGLGATLLKKPEIQALPLDEQMRLAVATRELETALQIGDRLLKSETVSALRLDVSGALDDYLRLAVRVRGDFKKARSALRNLEKRRDIPDYLAANVAVWREALDTLDPAPYSKPKLETAKRLIDDGLAMNVPGNDRVGLIHFVQASGLLHQFLESDPQNPREEAEAYLLLGRLDVQLSKNRWGREAEYYLEAAVRADPGSTIAGDAYLLLEETVSKGYVMTVGMSIPEPVRERLDNLKAVAFQSGD